MTEDTIANLLITRTHAAEGRQPALKIVAMNRTINPPSQDKIATEDTVANLLATRVHAAKIPGTVANLLVTRIHAAEGRQPALKIVAMKRTINLPSQDKIATNDTVANLLITRIHASEGRQPILRTVPMKIATSTATHQLVEGHAKSSGYVDTGPTAGGAQYDKHLFCGPAMSWSQKGREYVSFVFLLLFRPL